MKYSVANRNEKIVKIISKFTGIRTEKLIKQISDYGIEGLFTNAKVMELPDKKYNKLMELEEIILFKDDSNAKR